MPPTKRPAKKAAANRPRPQARSAPVEPDEDSREARTVMQRVDKLPEAPAVGRPNDKYAKLFEAVAGEFGPDVPVKLMEYADHRSARRILNQIQAGQTPVPGGPGCWAVRAIAEDVVDGAGVVSRGSALYVEWLGEA